MQNINNQQGGYIAFFLRGKQEKGTAILMATHDYRIIQKFEGKILRCENGIVGEVAAVPTF